jgi:hypothetical protein
MAVVACVADTPRLTRPVGAAAALCVVLVVAPPRTPEVLLRFLPLGGRVGEGEVDYIGVGRSATVLLMRGARWRLHTNGLPEAYIDPPEYPSDRRGEATWLGLLPVLARPNADHVLYVGLGAGISVGATPASVSRIDVAELEPEVVRANRSVASRRAFDPLAQSRVHLHIGDARGALALSNERYDAIVSQPSHPWTSGASHLYTREFFELASAHLEPDGVLVQWMGVDFITRPALRSLIATLLAVFPHLEVLRPTPTSLIFLASHQPIDLLDSAADLLAAESREPGRLTFRCLEDVAAIRVATESSLREVAAGAPLLTDDRNPLGSGLRRGLGAEGVEQFLTRHGSSSIPEGVQIAALIRSLLAIGQTGRVSEVIAGLEGAPRELARGWLAHDRGHLETAGLHFEKSLELDPSLEDARLGLLIQGRGGEFGRGLEDAVGEAARAAAKGDWQLVAEFEESLATTPLDHLLYRDVTRLRIDWRVALEQQGSVALSLVDAMLGGGWRFEDLMRRVHVARVIGETSLAWFTVDAALGVVYQPRHRNELLEVSRELPDVPGADEIRSKLLRATGWRPEGASR